MRVPFFISCSVLFLPNLCAQRIVSLAPSLTEITCDLGLCDRLVGVTDFCTYPPQVRDIAKVGGYIDPNLEIVVAMKPDWVLALPEHQTAIAKLEHLGIRVETLRNWSIEDIHQTIGTLGRLLQREQEAQRLELALAARREKFLRKREKPPSCLLVLGHEAASETIKEVFVVGRNGFLNEILYLAGGMNAYPKETPYFPKLSQETLLELDPDVIIALVPVDNLAREEMAKMLKTWQSVPQLRAVRNDNVHIVHAEHVLQAGPRYVDTLARISVILDGL